ncbi:MAG: hypothetical protein WCV68_04560 [Candidatus Paceibacterota bacterium]
MDNPEFRNWRLNKGLEYLYEHHHEITEENKKDIFRQAREYPETLFKEAGDRGGSVHSYIDRYFGQWIETGQKPDILTFCSQDKDYATWSSLRAAEAWCNNVGFTPLVSELRVWSEKYQVAGTVDAIGVIQDRLVLCDWKTSTSLRTGYWLQVGAYWGMFKELIHLTPQRTIIVRLDKERGISSVEEVQDVNKRFGEFRDVCRVYDSIQEINRLRKPRKETIKL